MEIDILEHSVVGNDTLIEEEGWVGDGCAASPTLTMTSKPPFSIIWRSNFLEGLAVLDHDVEATLHEKLARQLFEGLADLDQDVDATLLEKLAQQLFRRPRRP